MGKISIRGDIDHPNEIIICKRDRDTGFAMTVVLAGTSANQERCRSFLQEVEQIIREMESNGLTFQDVSKGIKLVSEMDAYFTHWRNENKHHTDTAFRAMQDAKEALQRDNDVDYTN